MPPVRGLAHPPQREVADRFHLLKNLLDGFEKFLHRQAPAISAVSQTVFRSSSADKASSSSNDNVATPPTAAQHLVTEQKQAKLKKREQLFNTIKELHASGVPTLGNRPPLEDEPQHSQTIHRLKHTSNTPPEQSAFLADPSLPAVSIWKLHQEVDRRPV